MLVALMGIMPLRVEATQREGTRDITGSGLNLYFLHDKVFGTACGHPLWARYNCGSDFAGQIDLGNAYRELNFTYRRDGGDLGNAIIEGKVGEAARCGWPRTAGSVLLPPRALL